MGKLENYCGQGLPWVVGYNSLTQCTYRRFALPWSRSLRYGGRGRVESFAPFHVGLFFFILDLLIRDISGGANSEVYNTANSAYISRRGELAADETQPALMKSVKRN